MGYTRREGALEGDPIDRGPLRLIIAATGNLAFDNRGGVCRNIDVLMHTRRIIRAKIKPVNKPQASSLLYQPPLSGRRFSERWDREPVKGVMAPSVGQGSQPEQGIR